MRIRKVSSLLIGTCVMIICCVHGIPQFNTDLGIGDGCNLRDGSPGKCKINKDCPYVIDLWKMNKRNDIVQCGFMGANQIVCCKENTFSARFSQVLCEGTVAKKPIKISLTDHIINGRMADVAEFPHFAALGYESEGSQQYDFRCGGTLIAENFILTAAHCCNQKVIKPVIVRLGKTSLDDSDEENGQDIKVQKIILHEQYSTKTKLNDIALLKLETNAIFAHNVWPACISSNTKGLMNNLLIIGFGRNNTDNRDTSDWLLKATADELPLNECQAKFNTIPGNKLQITKSQICVHSPKTMSDTCQGDSGGPIEYKKNNLQYVYGITSYGYACGSSFPSIYTRVEDYLPWIDEKINS